ncbi:MAG: hypothetical protein ACI9KE_004825 [Polyangiales bacterium]|jgi:hypothetical protein
MTHKNFTSFRLLLAVSLIGVFGNACAGAQVHPQTTSNEVLVPLSPALLESAAQQVAAQDAQCTEEGDLAELHEMEDGERAMRLHEREQMRVAILGYVATTGWRDIQMGALATLSRGGVTRIRHSGGEAFLSVTYDRFHDVSALCGWGVQPTTEPWMLERQREQAMGESP